MKPGSLRPRWIVATLRTPSPDINRGSLRLRTFTKSPLIMRRLWRVRHPFRGDALNALRADYEAMVADGLLLVDAESFDQLMEVCRQIESVLNAR